MSLLPLDGPSIQDKVSVTTSTPVEIKAGVSPLDERKAITIQPLVNDIYLYFGQEGETPSAATVAAKGLIIYGGAKDTYEASDTQKVWMLAVTATTDVIVVERA